MVEVCKWLNDAVSPVVFMIDDLANVWVDTNGNNKLDLGEDWGYWGKSENSSFQYLKKNFIEKYNDIKITFFVPVGYRVGVIENPSIKTISMPINCDEESKAFFRSLHEDSRMEIAYHGTNHGKVGPKAADFIQEWQTYRNIDEAINKINEGKEIYKDVIGEYPKGGKYPGYKSNDFSDESIDRSGFQWWCRYWNKGIENGYFETSGNDSNLITNYDVKYFGKNKVIDIPSNINGGMYNSYLNKGDLSIKNILRKILKILLIIKKRKEIDFLLKNRLVIGIEEHISPARDDGKIQTPNIFTDKKSLYEILNYLQKKEVWYCTCTELADYVRARDMMKIEIKNENTFIINTECYSSQITLRVIKNSSGKIILPNGEIVKIVNGIATVPILEGIYQIKE